MSYGVVAISDDSTSPDLRQAKQFAASLGIRSILATPLVEEDQHIGLLLLMHCGVAYNWRSSDLVMLRAIAEQTVLALANARLRNLVKNLGVTEEKSGLLKRASYLDILLAEVRRAAQNNSHVTLMLLNFGKAQELVRQAGEAAVEGLMQRVGQLVCAHIRQNDVAVRYDLTTVALVLADTDQQNSYLTLDRLRNVMGDLCLPDQVAGPRFSCGIAEARIDAEFDPVDMVTEVINRAEEALREALKDRENRVRALAPAEFELVPA
jgi:diguanylate cyclase (GGDEF)-like protein